MWRTAAVRFLQFAAAATLALNVMAGGGIAPAPQSAAAQTLPTAEAQTGAPGLQASCAPIIQGAGAQPYAEGVVLVGFREGASAAERALPGDFRPLARLGAVQLRTAVGEECATIERLRGDPRVAWAELDYLAQAATPAVAEPDTQALSEERRDFLAPDGLAMTPNDPGWQFQWGPAQVRAPEAWEVITGTEGLTIAIIDSGMQLDHPDLSAKVWRNPGEIADNGLDDDGNGKVDDVHGWHFYHAYTATGYVAYENRVVGDDFGHGTHVAGIAAAATNNGVGIAGINWGAKLMVVKVLDQYGNGWYSDIAAGITYAADNGARVINLSLGGAQPSETLCSAVDYARSRGAVVVAASGNQNVNVVYYPAACDRALAVAATNRNDERASFSNYGPEVDLAAPGDQIYSTGFNTNYLMKSGTSMAAPHVSAAAALLMGYAPELSDSDVYFRLLHNADDVDTPGPDPRTGWGRLNVLSALQPPIPRPDVWVEKAAPEAARPSETITYTIRYGNRGTAEATEVVITDTLPAEMEPAGSLTWPVGDLAADSGPFTLTFTATLPVTEEITITNQVEIAAAELDNNPENNHAQAHTWTGGAPEAGFLPTEAVLAVGETITFTNTSSGGEALSFEWDFGDGTQSTEREPAHSYEAAGVYTVTLTARSPSGSDEARGTMDVGEAPMAAFEAAAGRVVPGETITFTNQSTGTGQLSYAWDFGDGTTSEEASPAHAYAQPGRYWVTLTVESRYGQAQMQRRVEVWKPQVYLPWVEE